jgi:ribosomal protein S18 acetylase RimI-like enzyme
MRRADRRREKEGTMKTKAADPARPSVLQPRDCTLDDGTGVHVRDIRPDDADELRRGFERLSSASRYSRFLGPISTLSDRTLRYLTNVDGRNHVAIVATLPDGEGERGIAVARFVRDAERPNVADIAITVADELQGRGLGRMLATLLGELALERDIDRFRGEVLVDNTLCRGLLRDLGGNFTANGDGTLSFDVPLSPANDTAARQVLRASARGLLGASGADRPTPGKSA